MPEALLHGSRHQTRHKLSLRYCIMRLRFEDRCGEILTCGKTWPLTSPPGWCQVDKQTLSYSWKRHRVHLWHGLKSRRVSLICGTLSCGPQVPLSFLCIFTELGWGCRGGWGGRESKPLAFFFLTIAPLLVGLEFQMRSPARVKTACSQTDSQLVFPTPVSFEVGKISVTTLFPVEKLFG